MSQADSVTLPTLPAPLNWLGNPGDGALSSADALSITAGPKTDWFIDPEHGTTTDNAPALLMPVSGPCQLSAQVTANHQSTFDAGVLTVYHGPGDWAKLCLEMSPQGEVMVVSVVTRGGVSDDCNAIVIAGHSIHYRISKLDRAYAFHYSTDGARWHMVRFFTLGDSPDPRIGFLAQSPTGESCTAHFEQIRYIGQKLADIRSGE